MDHPDGREDAPSMLVRNLPGDTALSDDGRLYWDGSRWLPTPWAASAESAAARRTRYTRVGAARILILLEALGLLGFGILAAYCLLVLKMFVGSALDGSIELLAIVVPAGFALLVASAVALERPTGRRLAIALHVVLISYLLAGTVAGHDGAALAFAVLPAAVVWCLTCRARRVNV